jgi:hypothetical protein
MKSPSLATYLFKSVSEYVCRSRKTLCWSVGTLHARCVSASRRPQNGVPRIHPLGGQKDGSLRVLNRDGREGEWDQSTPLLQLPPLRADRCAFWPCHFRGGTDSACCLAEPAEFVDFTCLMSAPIALNWLCHLSPKIPLTRFLHPPRRRQPWIYPQNSAPWNFFLRGNDWRCHSIDCLFVRGS